MNKHKSWSPVFVPLGGSKEKFGVKGISGITGIVRSIGEGAQEGVELFKFACEDGALFGEVGLIGRFIREAAQ